MTTAISDLLIVKNDAGETQFLQATCAPCGFSGTIYPARFAALAVAMANRHDQMFHGDYSGYKEGYSA
jgi:hypothetical protein